MNALRAIARRVALALALLGWGAAPRGAAAAGVVEGGGEARRFALVIGNNLPPRIELPRLRYADDDAVRWTVLFATLGAEVETLTELDAESRQLYGGRRRRPTSPRAPSWAPPWSASPRDVAEARAHGGAHRPSTSSTPDTATSRTDRDT